MSDFRTGRLEFRPYTPADEDHFAGLLGDPEVTRWMGVPARPIREVFRRGFDPATKPDWDIWAIWENGTFVGHGELKPSPDEHVDGHELVYAIVPGAWGRGLGTEIAEGITKYGLETLGLDAVHATVAPENEASVRLLRKIGYTDAGSWVEDDGETTLWMVRTA
ncbi:GNAT family acetyltransferase [Actinorhabdospora filicis]|uniref:GNAT family acetyltransferase n=1 Tax=Actinorhabdospora filicis TaxID=1785913 RepID=A0A9W6WCZ4_9ACTN|nr:GNAT family N-acetyltransferase [Actinorhabdospora filicis]GLZ80315.1 GNAT family acetyltransferase [Actinorhabdospora filicis]